MRSTLVTGATGALGTPTVARLRAAGHAVRALSRRTGPGLTTGDLRTGVGISEAVAGADTVLHLATGPRGKGDVEATRHLLDAATIAGVQHLILISIVGIDEIPLGYYRDKVVIERLVRESGLPHTIVRDAVPLLRGSAADRPAPLADGPRTALPAAADRRRRGRRPARRAHRLLAGRPGPRHWWTPTARPPRPRPSVGRSHRHPAPRRAGLAAGQGVRRLPRGIGAGAGVGVRAADFRRPHGSSDGRSPMKTLLRSGLALLAAVQRASPPGLRRRDPQAGHRLDRGRGVPERRLVVVALTSYLPSLSLNCSRWCFHSPRTRSSCRRVASSSRR